MAGSFYPPIEPVDDEISNQAIDTDAEPIAQNAGDFLATCPKAPLHFGTSEESSAWKAEQLTKKQSFEDPSYPRTEEDKAAWVSVLKAAFQNLDNVSDGPKHRNGWENIIKGDPKGIEEKIWRFLDKVMEAHRIEGKLEPGNTETRNARKWDSFLSRMQYILGVVTYKKTLCRRLTAHDFISSFIDAPELHATRIDNNRKINESKKRKIDVGNLALKNLKSQLEIEDEEFDDPSYKANHEILIRAVSSTIVPTKSEDEESPSASHLITPSKTTGRSKLVPKTRKSTSKSKTPRSKVTKTARVKSEHASPSVLPPSQSAMDLTQPFMPEANEFDEFLNGLSYSFGGTSNDDDIEMANPCAGYSGFYLPRSAESAMPAETEEDLTNDSDAFMHAIQGQSSCLDLALQNPPQFVTGSQTNALTNFTTPESSRYHDSYVLSPYGHPSSPSAGANVTPTPIRTSLALYSEIADYSEDEGEGKANL